jgi:hypothetical protein
MREPTGNDPRGLRCTFPPNVAIGLMLHRDVRSGQAAGRASEPGSEQRYYSQESQHHYHEYDHHYDGDQVVAAHSTTSQDIHPHLGPENRCPSEKPRKQKKSNYNQNYHHKYRYEPTPHVLTSPVKRRSLKNRRQHEHDQEQDHQDSDHYAELPTYTPSPRSSPGRRTAANIYPFRLQRNSTGYRGAAP